MHQNDLKINFDTTVKSVLYPLPVNTYPGGPNFGLSLCDQTFLR